MSENNPSLRENHAWLFIGDDVTIIFIRGNFLDWNGEN
jgi:hypothetical protein